MAAGVDSYSSTSVVRITRNRRPRAVMTRCASWMESTDGMPGRVRFNGVGTGRPVSGIRRVFITHPRFLGVATEPTSLTPPVSGGTDEDSILSVEQQVHDHARRLRTHHILNAHGGPSWLSYEPLPSFGDV